MEAREILNILPGAPMPENLTKYYRSFRSKWHPDSSHHSVDSAALNQARAKEAYLFLMEHGAAEAQTENPSPGWESMVSKHFNAVYGSNIQSIFQYYQQNVAFIMRWYH